MTKIKNFISNALKYYINYLRVKKLRKQGAKIGKNVVICKKCKFDNPEKLTIGDNVYIGNKFYANCIGGLTIGTGTLISYYCTVMTYNHDYKEDLFMPYGLSNIYKEVVIKNNVWIGINVNIVGGVIIEENSIVGMGSTVAKTIPANSIFAGGRILSEREEKTHKYDLLQVRSIYHPMHYLKFVKKVRKFKKDIISFDEIKSLYNNNDIFILIYRWSENNNFIVDWKNETINKNKIED